MELRVLAARLGALTLVIVTAVVAVVAKIGPVMVVFGTGRGLHALDVVLILVGVPLAVVLLRYAERVERDDGEKAVPDPAVPWWRFWEWRG